MIYRTTGQLAPNFHVLGDWYNPCYLLDGPHPVLFESGFSFLGNLYVEEARRILRDRRPEFLFLTHIHFDHCGAARLLREAFPRLQIGASAEGAELLRRPRVVERIRSFTEEARSTGSGVGVEPTSDAPFEVFDIDTKLLDGDEVPIGNGDTVEVLATPGHTRDFLSYYLPHRKLLIASEAVGGTDALGHVLVEFAADYEAYVSSLRRLSQLEVEVLCLGHGGVLTGPDARGFADRALRATERYRRWVEELLDEESGSVDRVVTRIKAVQWDPVPEPKQPESAYLTNTRARVNLLAARLRASGSTLTIAN